MIRWEISKQRYDTTNGYIGNAKCFYIYYDGGRAKDDPLIYGLVCYLPSIKTKIGNYENKTIAKDFAEKVFNCWLDKANLQIKE